MKLFDADATARSLDWPALIAAVEATIRDSNAGRAGCPPRMSVPLADDAVWLLMPAWSTRADVAACKLITVHPGNRQRGLPTIQGDILVIRASTGERLALLDGPTVTARRTAAVTVLAIRLIRQARAEGATGTAGAAGPAPGPVQAQAPDQAQGPAHGPAACLIIGCGVQGRSHLEAIGAEYPGIEFFLCSRSEASAKQLAAHAAANGLAARAVPDARAVLAGMDLVVCCTDASEVCLHDRPREGAIIAAIGSFKPEMSELSADVMRYLGRNVLLDSADAGHEAGEFFQAGIDPEGLPSLFTWQAQGLPEVARTVLFKSCGSALWDLAAAQVVSGR